MNFSLAVIVTSAISPLRRRMRAFPSPLAVVWQRCWPIVLLVALAFVAGCQTSSPAGFQWQDPVSDKANFSADRVQEGDVVSVSFEYSTNFNTVQKVSLTGMLNLPPARQLKAAGKSIEQLQSEVLKLYESQVTEERVTVNILTTTVSVYVSGAVLRPGKIPLERPMTALEAVMEAGGFDLVRARLSHVKVVRFEGGSQQTFQLDLKKGMEGRGDALFYVKPFDIIHVPMKTMNF